MMPTDGTGWQIAVFCRSFKAAMLVCQPRQRVHAL
jgi:hypothetical protein